MKLWSPGDGMRSKVENKLDTIDLTSRKIEPERVALLNFRVSE